MYYLLRIKIILLVSFFVFSKPASAQTEIYRPFHDDLPYYFGLTLGYNSSFLHQVKSRNFIQSDSILVAEPGASGGIALGLLATGRLSDHFQIRVNPQLIIGGARYFSYTLSAASVQPGEPIFQKKVLPATIVSFPIHFKFNSDRIDNFRTYLLFGVKFDTDLSSNSTVRTATDMIKLKRNDFGLEGGIGFNFFLPFVTISPEIKISYGLTDLHQQDPSLKYSNVLGAIQSRMIMFSLHFED
ncbi:MAG: PorT family protein [Bacteroidota bacterium]|nr:PorT family protein [Bacteroidota bacterium]